MSRQDRRNAIIIAAITAIAAVLAALIHSGAFKQAATPAVSPAAHQPPTGNKAQTKGDQSPAVAGAQDVDITYGEKKGAPAKKK
jgi:hypothetical protein